MTKRPSLFPSTYTPADRYWIFEQVFMDMIDDHPNDSVARGVTPSLVIENFVTLINRNKRTLEDLVDLIGRRMEAGERFPEYSRNLDGGSCTTELDLRIANLRDKHLSLKQGAD